MKTTVILPDGLIPEGSTLEWRIAKEGEQYLTHSESYDKLQLYDSRSGGCRPDFVVVPPYCFPDCLPEGWWISKDADCRWWVHEYEPTLFDDNQWRAVVGREYFIDWLDIKLPDVGFRDSKMQVTR